MGVEEARPDRRWIISGGKMMPEEGLACCGLSIQSYWTRTCFHRFESLDDARPACPDCGAARPDKIRGHVARCCVVYPCFVRSVYIASHYSKRKRRSLRTPSLNVTAMPRVAQAPRPSNSRAAPGSIAASPFKSPVK